MKTKLLPDASFFICFLGDLCDVLNESTRLNYLNRFLDTFSVEITPVVYSEINKKTSSEPIEGKFLRLETPPRIKNDPVLEYLRPLVGKGEYEVIALSFSYYENKQLNFFFVLDDDIARKIVVNSVNEIKPNLIGTVGLIGFCSSERLVFSSAEAISLLESIQKSNFRISSKIVNDIIQKLKILESHQ